MASLVAAPEVPQATTLVHAAVTDPTVLDIAADGTIYVGRDDSGSGGSFAAAVKIHRIGPGGSPVTEFGDTAPRGP